MTKAVRDAMERIQKTPKFDLLHGGLWVDTESALQTELQRMYDLGRVAGMREAVRVNYKDPVRLISTERYVDGFKRVIRSQANALARKVRKGK